MRIMIFGLISLALSVIGESFPAELKKNRAQMINAVGMHRFLKLEDLAKTKEIYRITQLLEIDGFGEKTILKLEAIIGVRFSDDIELPTCYRSKFC